MRNEIFARHSFIFKSKAMAAYFSQQPWYRAQYDDIAARLTPLEKTNIMLIKKLEK